MKLKRFIRSIFRACVRAVSVITCDWWEGDGDGGARSSQAVISRVHKMRRIEREEVWQNREFYNQLWVSCLVNFPYFLATEFLSSEAVVFRDVSDAPFAPQRCSGRPLLGSSQHCLVVSIITIQLFIQQVQIVSQPLKDPFRGVRKRATNVHFIISFESKVRLQLEIRDWSHSLCH